MNKASGDHRVEGENRGRKRENLRSAIYDVNP